MVYGQFSLYKQNIVAGCFHLSLITVKDVCTIAANTLLVNGQTKHMLGIVSYSHRTESKQNLVAVTKKTNKLIIYLITHMYNSSAVDDFGVILAI